MKTNCLKPNNQTGATLFVGLILLLAISIISIAAMRTSVLDLAITNNKQQYANTFEASERVINTRLSDLRLEIDGTQATDTVIAGSTETTSVSTKNTAGSNVVIANITSDVTYRNEGGGTGWELDGTVYHFQLDAEASAPGRGAQSNHRVGFFIAAPAP